MTEQEDFGQIVVAAFIGSMIGASLFVVAVALVGMLPPASDAEASQTLGLALFALPFGWVISALIVWPVGIMIGGLISLTGPSTGAKAAAGGALTGFVLIAPVVLLGSDFPSDVGIEEWTYLIGFTALGAVSGWLAWRWVLRRRAPS